MAGAANFDPDLDLGQSLPDALYYSSDCGNQVGQYGRGSSCVESESQASSRWATKITESESSRMVRSLARETVPCRIDPLAKSELAVEIHCQQDPAQ